MELSKAVKKAAIDNNINGVMALSEHCGLSYYLTDRVWKGDNSAKIVDVMQVLASVGLKLTIETKGE